MLKSLTKILQMSSTQHLAAVLHEKGTPLKVEHRPTPTPGANELLIEVKSIALNPIDYAQRDFGFAVFNYPAVLGSDIAGTVLSVGPEAPPATPKPGSRVLAFAPAFFKSGHPNYGGFQARVIVPVQNVCPIPYDLTFNEAVLIPMSAATAWAGWYSMGIARGTKYSASDKQGFLVWGGSSSIGSGAIQLAKAMGFSVYATASEKHHAYVKQLGASKTFDYRTNGVTDEIVKAAKEDGVTIRYGFDAIGQIQSCLDILKHTSKGLGKLATSKPFGDISRSAPEVEVIFMKAPEDSKPQSEHFGFIFNQWLKGKLERKEWTPSPKIQIVGGGLESINSALDELKSGVSGVKLVVEV
jgi:NADPH:quinone reductase-like Zn-dependent oxidoreductase